jgi:hypothetical protein
MYCDPERVGSLAVSREALLAADGRTLFKMLLATTLFQRRQDQQIFRILRGLDRTAAAEMGSSKNLLRLVDKSPCPHMRTNEALQRACDLSKTPETREGVCTANPEVACHMKRHTVHLKRYGHFGKVPTSLALMLREEGVRDLVGLRGLVFARTADPRERADLLETALCAAWRVSQKIGCMFLSAISNPDLSPGLAPWSDGLDWSRYVVVDSNVDLFLRAIRYRGSWSYDGRRDFIRELARHIDLSQIIASLRSFNPRILQQAMYVFMSRVNRKALSADCVHVGATACRSCPRPVSRLCPLRRY